MAWIVQNPRGLPPGTPIVSQKQGDGSFKSWSVGDTVTKREFPDDGWEWLIANDLIKQVRAGGGD